MHGVLVGHIFLRVRLIFPCLKYAEIDVEHGLEGLGDELEIGVIHFERRLDGYHTGHLE